jgi:hypothetical protein
MACMDTWIKRCLPTDGQKLVQQQIGGARALMRFLCTNETALRRGNSISNFKISGITFELRSTVQVDNVSRTKTLLKYAHITQIWGSIFEMRTPIAISKV